MRVRSTFRPLHAARLLGATAVAIVALSASGVAARGPGTGCGETSGPACAQPNDSSVAPSAPAPACGETGVGECSQPAPGSDMHLSVSSDAVPCGEPGGGECIQP